MKSREYSRVFGGEKFPIGPSEVIVDIGSGKQDIARVVPHGTVVQLDPMYREVSIDPGTGECGETLRLPVEIGLRIYPTNRAVSKIVGMSPDRVTMANTFRHIPPDNRVVAIAQMLWLSEGGIAQIYPYRDSTAQELIPAAEDLGFDVRSDPVSVWGVRQAAYAGLGINNTLTIASQPDRVGPADQLRLARLVAPNPF